MKKIRFINMIFFIETNSEGEVYVVEMTNIITDTLLILKYINKHVLY